MNTIVLQREMIKKDSTDIQPTLRLFIKYLHSFEFEVSKRLKY